MAIFKSLLAVTIALIATANAAPNLEARQIQIGPTTLADWTYIGCWSDNPARRTLQVITSTDPQMTVEKCTAFCKTTNPNGNFNLAGVEFGQECWCSNAMDNGPDLIASSNCNQACIGNDLEACGGPQALSVYRQKI